MRFTWDPANDPNHVVGDNYFIEDTGEQRFQIFIEPGSDVIRIVSARKAVHYEERIYNDQFRQEA